jgi:hypothetical protein
MMHDLFHSGLKVTIRKKPFAAAALCALIGLAAIPGTRAQTTSSLSTIWDARVAQQGQLLICHTENGGGSFGFPVGSGPLDGPDQDGVSRDDVVIAPFLASAGAAGERLGSGKLYVVFGRPDISGTVEVSAGGLPPGTVEIWGARAGDFLGCEVDVHDVTGDGFADILACAQNADGFGSAADRTGAGSLYVILGRAQWPDRIDLATAGAPEGVIQILGAHGPPEGGSPSLGDRCGLWASAGDVTGDGVNDVLVTADLVDGPDGRNTNAGALYVIPGGTNLRTAGGALIPRVDLSSPGSVKVFTIYGVDSRDQFGSCVISADWDRDGIDDIACSAGLARLGASFFGYSQGGAPGSAGGDGIANTRPEAGEVYVIYGRSLAEWERTPTIRLTPDADANTTIIYGEDQAGAFGEDLSAADFDGDGIPELGVGALTSNAPVLTGGLPYRENSGVGYIFWGSELERGSVVDLATIGADARVTRFYGEKVQDIGADSMRMADIDNDGMADLLFSSPNNPGDGGGGQFRPLAGDLKVIFGRADRLRLQTGAPRHAVDFAQIPADIQVYQLVGAEAGDLLGYSMAVGDFDGDGYTDMFPNQMLADGVGNQHPDAGEIVVISGKTFSQLAGRGEALPPTLESYRAAPGQGPYYAGAAGMRVTLVGSGFQQQSAVTAGGVRAPQAAVRFVSSTELVLDLDLAPEIRNRPGPLVLRVENPNGDATTPLTTITLVGPEIRDLKVKRKGSKIKITVTGVNFRSGVIVKVSSPSGDAIPIQSTKVVAAGKVRATVSRSDAPSGSTVVVTVENPGPVPSEARSAVVP